MTTLHVKKLHADAQLPTRGTTHAAGLDVCAYLNTRVVVTFWTANGGDEHCWDGGGLYGPVYLHPSERALIPTGLSMAVDPGFCIKAYPRSGASIKRGLTLVNAVGVIDADYRGEVMLTVINLSNETQVIEHGERLAQLIVERVEPVAVVESDTLPDAHSDRDGGFGSTGQ